MADMQEDATIITPTMRMLQLNKQSGYNWKYRRFQQWLENYEFYRDTIQTNRLTQRQNVNIPIMKQTIRTLLKDVDDMPVLYFENLDNDKQAEIFKNEYWKEMVICNNMEIQDIIDKRQVFLFGRSFGQWQIVDGKVKWTVLDPMDILIDRYADPSDINSTRWLIHNHIFVPLVKLQQNKIYNQEIIREMAAWYKSEEGLKKVSDNEDLLNEKNQRMTDMGVLDANSPVLGETICELSLHFVRRNTDASGKEIEEQYYLYVEIDNQRIIFEAPLEEVIGKTKDNYWRTHIPYDTWADDVEKLDFWSDAVADVVRQNNKVVNTWYSQLVENRTMKSFGMRFFDATNDSFQPQTWQPMPFGFYGVPGKPSDIMQDMTIPDLADSMADMEFVMNINEKATGATAAQQGVQEQKQTTLGEVQLDLKEAKERIKGMSKFYTKAWLDRGMIFVKLLEAAPDKIDAMTVFRKGRNTDNIFSRDIAPEDWYSKLGYNVKVWSQEDRDNQNFNSLQKMNYSRSLMPQNQKLNEIAQRKSLEFAELKPDEINEVMEEEQRLRQEQAAMMQMMGAAGGMPGGGAPGMPAPGGKPMLPGGAPGAQPILPAGGGR
jgi:hypothetical protein